MARAAVGGDMVTVCLVVSALMVPVVRPVVDRTIDKLAERMAENQRSRDD